MASYSVQLLCALAGACLTWETVDRYGDVNTIGTILNGSSYTPQLSGWDFNCSTALTEQASSTLLSLCTIGADGDCDPAAGPFVVQSYAPGQSQYAVAATESAGNVGCSFPFYGGQGSSQPYFLTYGAPSAPSLSISGYDASLSLTLNASAYSAEYGFPLKGCLLSWGQLYNGQNVPAAFPSDLSTLPPQSLAWPSPAQSSTVTLTDPSVFSIPAGVPTDFFYVCYNQQGVSPAATVFGYALQSALPAPLTLLTLGVSDQQTMTPAVWLPPYTGLGGAYWGYDQLAAATFPTCSFTVTDASGATLASAQAQSVAANSTLQLTLTLASTTSWYQAGTVTLTASCSNGVASTTAAASFTDAALLTPPQVSVHCPDHRCGSYAVTHRNLSTSTVFSVVAATAFTLDVAGFGPSCPVSFTDALSSTPYGACTANPDPNAPGACLTPPASTAGAAGSRMQVRADSAACYGADLSATTPLITVVPAVPSPPQLSVAGFYDGAMGVFTITVTASQYATEYGAGLTGCVLAWGLAPSNLSALLPAQLQSQGVDVLPSTAIAFYSLQQGQASAPRRPHHRHGRPRRALRPHRCGVAVRHSVRLL